MEAIKTCPHRWASQQRAKWRILGLKRDSHTQEDSPLMWVGELLLLIVLIVSIYRKNVVTFQHLWDLGSHGFKMVILS